MTDRQTRVGRKYAEKKNKNGYKGKNPHLPVSQLAMILLIFYTFIILLNSIQMP
jgi:hypothetical protein